MANFPSVALSNFRGLNKTQDVLSLIPGQLLECRNYTFMTNGGLEERGGGANVDDPPAAGICYSLANYRMDDGTEFFITNQGTDAYYYSSGWNALSLTLTADKKVRWEGAGFGANRALYGVNGNESVIKVYDNSGTPAAELLTIGNGYTNTSPTTLIDIKLHKNRLFGIEDETMYYTGALDFNEWPSANNFKVAPGVDGFCKKLEVWGDALYIFKEYGVYVVPNADDAPADWVLLRTDALTGTQSPESVVRTKIGIIYYSSDDKIRIIGPGTSYSTSEYQLGDSGSPIISHDIQILLDEDADRTKRANIAGFEFEDKYFFTYKSVNSGAGNNNDKCYFCDVTKFNQYENIPVKQPYWGECTNFDFQFMTKQLTSGRTKAYGMTGSNGAVVGTAKVGTSILESYAGVLREILNTSINNDNGSAIDSYAALGWIPIAGEFALKKLMQLVVNAYSGSNTIDITVNGAVNDDYVPVTGEGVKLSFTSLSTTRAVCGTAVCGTSVITASNIKSNKYKLNIKGNYFTVEFGNQYANQFNRINKVVFYYRVLRNK